MALPSYQDTTSQEWQMDINGSGASVVQGADSLAQSVQLLLATPRYSIPFMPNYGVLAMEYIGTNPIKGIALLINDIQTQIAAHIPAIEDLQITWSIDQAHVTVNLRWTSTLGQGQNTFTYGIT